MRTMRTKWRALLIALTVVLVVGVSAGSASAATPKLYVQAAASLNHAFPAMVAPFKSAYPQYSSLQFVFNFAGSDTLLAQIEAGAPSDVFAAASLKYGNQLYNDGYAKRRASSARTSSASSCRRPTRATSRA